jgi:phosphoribosylanthranilate isomerase
MRLKIKVCCISSIDEANLAISAGADALGLVGNMPSGPGPISDELIYAIAQSVAPPVSTFMLTSETSAEQIVEHYKRTFTNTIQMVDTLTTGSYQDIRKVLPHVKIVQVIHMIDEQSIDQALCIADFVDALLLDSGNPNAAFKELGGTGRIHNWQLSKKIVEQSPVPVFLAGGLHAGNVREAIEQVNPYGVDLCSGVRTNGKLDSIKLREFVNAVSSAW